MVNERVSEAIEADGEVFRVGEEQAILFKREPDVSFRRAERQQEDGGMEEWQL